MLCVVNDNKRLVTHNSNFSSLGNIGGHLLHACYYSEISGTTLASTYITQNINCIKHS